MRHPDDDYDIDALIFEVFRLNGALAVAGDALTEPLGLTGARWQVMGSIARSGGATVAELGRRIGLTRQSVQRVVTELVSEGYVELIDNPRHIRARNAVLTEQGQRSLEAITAAWTPITQELSERFGQDLLRNTARLLTELRDAFRGFAAAAVETPSDVLPSGESNSNETLSLSREHHHTAEDAAGVLRKDAR